MVAAAADSYGGTAAADTVNQLRSDGYNAELNLDGTPPVDAYVVRLIALTISTNGRSAFARVPSSVRRVVPAHGLGVECDLERVRLSAARPNTSYTSSMSSKSKEWLTNSI